MQHLHNLLPQYNSIIEKGKLCFNCERFKLLSHIVSRSEPFQQARTQTTAPNLLEAVKWKPKKPYVFNHHDRLLFKSIHVGAPRPCLARV